MSDMVAELLWILSDNRETLRLELPPIPIADMPEPIEVHLDFDAVAVDDLIEHLTMFRSQMLPAPTRN